MTSASTAIRWIGSARSRRVSVPQGLASSSTASIAARSEARKSSRISPTVEDWCAAAKESTST